MTWDASRRVFLRGAGLAASASASAPTSLLVRTARAAVGEQGAGQGLPARRRRRAQLLRPLRRPRVLQPAPGHRPSPARVRRRRRRTWTATSACTRSSPPSSPTTTTAGSPSSTRSGNPQVTRSHFDAQDFQESGTPGDKQTPTGWLDRAIARIPGTEVTQAVSFSSQLVRSFLGRSPCSWRRRSRPSTCGPATGVPRRRRCSRRCTGPTRPRSAPPGSRRSRR